MKTTAYPLAGVVAVLALIGTGLAAPAPKPSDKPEAPPTDEQYATSSNNLKQLGLGLHNYHDVHGRFPANQYTKDGKPGLSWRVQILPYLEEDALYKQFKLDEPWNSDHNLKLVERIPKVFTPVRGKAEKGETFYQMFAGQGTVLGEKGQGIGIVAITDGTSNTFMAAEGGSPVIWTKPDDLAFDGKQVPRLGGMFNGEFHALFADGAVRRLPKGVDSDALIRAIGRHDGLVLDIDEAIRQAKGKE